MHHFYYTSAISKKCYVVYNSAYQLIFFFSPRSNHSDSSFRNLSEREGKRKVALKNARIKVKASASNAGDQGSIPGSGRSSGKGNGDPLQYSCLENPMDGGAW